MVLVAAIILLLAGSAYFWGKPLLDKRTTVTDVSTAKSFMIELDRQIVEVSRSGGTKTINVPRISGSSIDVNETGNEILFRFLAPEAMMEMDGSSTSVPVDTYDVSPEGSYGSSPRIILLEGEPQENNLYLMTLRLKYRTLQTDTAPLRGYRIVLLDGGYINPGQASSRVIANFLRRETDPAGCCSGMGERTDTVINVSIS
ncbi:MAG: hypothetical protein JSV63_00655 [Candidatus Aenigmatarchaeota archaeon]|nr:MAG: hypothetical protein JSV63_00655 [Candidatus Aenigmarchaeota archaeon]